MICCIFKDLVTEALMSDSKTESKEVGLSKKLGFVPNAIYVVSPGAIPLVNKKE